MTQRVIVFLVAAQNGPGRRYVKARLSLDAGSVTTFTS